MKTQALELYDAYWNRQADVADALGRPWHGRRVARLRRRRTRRERTEVLQPVLDELWDRARGNIMQAVADLLADEQHVFRAGNTKLLPEGELS